MKRRVRASLAALVSLRAGKRCEYCHAPQQILGQAFHLDHISPSSAGGEMSVENLCYACPHCNIAKSNRTTGLDPKTGNIVRLFNPRIDDWDKHFRWHRTWELLVGQTAIGRATIVALNMNDKLLQEARPFWRLAGRIP